MGEWLLLKFAKCLVVGSQNSPVGWNTIESSEQLQVILKITNNGMLTVRHGNSIVEVGDLRGPKQIQAYHQNGSLLVATQIKRNVVRKWRGLFIGKDYQKQCEVCYSKIMSFIFEKRQRGGQTGSHFVPQERDLPSAASYRECPTPENVLETSVPCTSRNSSDTPEETVTAPPNKLSKKQDFNESANFPSQSNWFRISQTQMGVINGPSAIVNEDNPCAESSSRNVTCSSNYFNKVCNNKQATKDIIPCPLSDSNPSNVLTMDDVDIIEIPITPHAPFTGDSVSTTSPKRFPNNDKVNVKRRRLYKLNPSPEANEAAKDAFESITSSLRNAASANTSVEGLNYLDDDALKQVITKCLLDPNLPHLVSRVHSIMSNF